MTIEVPITHADGSRAVVIIHPAGGARLVEVDRAPAADETEEYLADVSDADIRSGVVVLAAVPAAFLVLWLVRACC